MTPSLDPARPRWGILGTAGIADALIGGVREAGAGSVVAVASRDLDRARRWAEARGVPCAFGSYDELLRSEEIDVVYNPLPNSLHAEWTIRALESGRRVLCEKPLTVDLAQAQQAASKRMRQPVAEAFMYRFHPIYDTILGAIGVGQIGRVTTIYSQFTFPLDDWTQNPASAKLGGGALRDVGCYCVNVSRLIAGREPRRAAAMRRGAAVDHTLVGMLEFPNGVLAHFECGIESHERHRLEIGGTEGAIFVERPWFPGEGEASFILRRGQTEEIVRTPGGNGYALEAADFAQAWRTGWPPRWTVDDAVANMAVVDALLASAREGATAEVSTAE
jgi:predicted dehydrogenase